METLRRTFAQFQELVRGMAPSQRMTLVAVPLLVLAALAFVMYSGGGPAEEALLAGKSFSAEELRHAQEALQQAGLAQFRVEGQKIYVPRSEANRYSAALIANKGLPAQFGAELEKMHDKASPFSSESQRREMLELAKQRELAKMFRSIPDIEDAGVIWERGRPKSFNGESKVTATVSVRPRSGRELSNDLAQSLRLAVAGAVAGLDPKHVTVINLRNGQAIQNGDANGPFNSQFLDQIKMFREEYRRNIADALAYIPNVLVTVNVDLENLKTSWLQEKKIGKEMFPVKSVDQEDKDTTNETRPSSEPGVNSNQPRNLKSTTANSAKSTEKKLTTSENVPLSESITSKEFVGLLPRSVQVTVSIPKEYYKAVAVKRGEPEADKVDFQKKVTLIETETKKDVLQKVAKLIPTGVGAPAPETAVSVSSIDRLDVAEATLDTPMGEQVTDALTRWGGPVGLGLFAVWTLWMLNRSLPKLPPAPTPAAAGTTKSSDKDEEEEDASAPRRPTKRDQLQTLVRDNPEMAASVINRWVLPAK